MACRRASSRTTPVWPAVSAIMASISATMRWRSSANSFEAAAVTRAAVANITGSARSNVDGEKVMDCASVSADGRNGIAGRRSEGSPRPGAHRRPCRQGWNRACRPTWSRRHNQDLKILEKRIKEYVGGKLPDDDLINMPPKTVDDAAALSPRPQANSSKTFSMRYFLPSWVRSSTKSSDPT